MSLAIAAGVAVKIPELFGFHITEDSADISLYARNFSFFILPFLAGYFAWKHSISKPNLLWLTGAFLVTAIIMNLYPFKSEGDTVALAALHLPIALWFITGIAYTAGRWKEHEQRMGFMRFTGEWFIQYVLIACGGGVLMLFTMFIFETIGIEAEPFMEAWMLPCGAVGAIIISALLVETRHGIIRNMASILARLFTPLFVILFLVFLITLIWTDSSMKAERELLIGLDLLLVLVLGLHLYSISTRDPQAPYNLFDGLQFILIVCALIVDILALCAIAVRITEFGFSPNKVAALGENIILLVNLAWSAVLYVRFMIKRSVFTPIERWQTTYIPIYTFWALVVVVVFPVVFGFK